MVLKNSNSHSRQDKNNSGTWNWTENTSGSLSPFAFVSFSTSVHDKQTHLSALCPAWLPPASKHCIYLRSLARDTHYSLKPLSESERVSRALIRTSYLYSESTDARALRTRRQCNLHHFQETEQMLLHIPPPPPPPQPPLTSLPPPSTITFCLCMWPGHTYIYMLSGLRYRCTCALQVLK